MPTTVTAKGQVTIPKRIREALGLKPGTKVEFVLDGHGHAIVESVAPDAVASAAGALRPYARRRAGESEMEMMERVRREVANEAAREGRPSRHQRSS
jgi:AbrB family looped-hinge helix DNA binding protein